MKVSYLITAHKNPQQIARLISRLNSENVSFIIHIDKKTDDETYREIMRLCHSEKVCFIEPRVNCNYLGFGILQATINGIKTALETTPDFDFLINLSGQDYPIKPNEYIKDFLKENEDRSFISYHALPYNEWLPDGGLNRYESWYFEIGRRQITFPFNPEQFPTLQKTKPLPFLIKTINSLAPRKRKFIKSFRPYGGWAFWCLNRKHSAYAIDFIADNPEFLNYFKHVCIPDEMFFQTLFLNSPYADQFINDDLRHLEWIENTSHPRTYISEDFGRLQASKKLFARKFDPETDADILDLIDRNLL